jgi:hypothetical protein
VKNFTSSVLSAFTGKKHHFFAFFDFSALRDKFRSCHEQNKLIFCLNPHAQNQK